MPTQRTIIVVTGRPATGKSSLVGRLRTEHAWPVISKDTIKEALFDTLGTGDREWSRRLSDASYELMFRWAPSLIENSPVVVLEANFRSPDHRARITRLVSEHAARLLLVELRASPDVVLSRLRERAASMTRHAGHLDRELAEEAAKAASGAPGDGEPDWPTMAARLELDTDVLDDGVLRQYSTRVAVLAGRTD